MIMLAAAQTVTKVIEHMRYELNVSGELFDIFGRVKAASKKICRTFVPNQIFQCENRNQHHAWTLDQKVKGLKSQVSSSKDLHELHRFPGEKRPRHPHTE